MNSAEESARRIVVAMLDHARLRPSPDELETLVAAYPGMRKALDPLYAMSSVRYEEPAVVYQARWEE